MPRIFATVAAVIALAASALSGATIAVAHLFA
jgi:hypothetical protein